MLFHQRPSEVARHIINLCERDPSGWTCFNRAILTHEKTELNIWIANSDYGIRWWTGARDQFYHDQKLPKPSDVDLSAVYKASQKVLRYLDDIQTTENIKAYLKSLDIEP